MNFESSFGFFFLNSYIFLFRNDYMNFHTNLLPIGQFMLLFGNRENFKDWLQLNQTFRCIYF